MVAQCQLQQTDDIEIYDKCASYAIDHLNSNFGQDHTKCKCPLLSLSINRYRWVVYVHFLTSRLYMLTGVNLNFEDLRRLERNVRIQNLESE